MIAVPLALAFLIGSVPFGYIVSVVFFKRDIRAVGSGNIGAANALRTLGKKAGLAVLALDVLKGVAAVVVAARLAAEPGVAAPLAGLAAMLGHCYTPWLRFKGGKGVATFLGATCALSWESAAAFAIVWLAIVLPTGFSSVGSILGVTAAAAVVSLRDPRTAAWIFAAGSLALVLWKHRENLNRLRAGTENRLTLLKR
ncbi:MAG: glycerol-3-phosphate 1-O-acyltransferase PlsY [Candidatus Eremiobacteraeota bacterium]|nr:glycerol-3-phosphate 1-O-acyltransferase PlsY [Candidatus Eremiobacteraeota bacterium]